MGEGEEDERGAGDGIGSDVSGDILNEAISKGRPHVLVSDAVVASTVFESPEVLLSWIRRKVLSGRT